MKYKLAALGGTFDFLHKGHKTFLLKAFSVAERVLIGLTSNEYTTSQKNGLVSDFLERKNNLILFLKDNNLLDRSEIIPINDSYGPALTNTYPIDVLVVTKDTEEVGKEINVIRQNKKLHPFDIISIDLVTNNSYIISSSFIRGNVMDVDGNMKIPREWLEKDLFLPEEKRIFFQEPFGTLVKNIDLLPISGKKLVATVGDITTKKFNEKKIYPKIAIVDFFVERKKSFDNIKDLGFSGKETLYSISNPAGSITTNAWKTILDMSQKISSNKSSVLLVKGEEDLLVLPLVIVLPVSFVIYYGQPHMGIVELAVTMESKKQARELIEMLRTTRGY